MLSVKETERKANIRIFNYWPSLSSCRCMIPNIAFNEMIILSQTGHETIQQISFHQLQTTSGRSGLLPPEGHWRAEPEAAVHHQRQREAAHGARQRQRQVRHQVLRLRAGGDRGRRRIRVEDHQERGAGAHWEAKDTGWGTICIALQSVSLWMAV